MRMSDMRRSLILLIAICSAFCLKSFASVSSNQMTEPEYVINSGYSEAAAEEILKVKSRAAGQPVEPLYDKSYNRATRFFRNIYGYLDPSQDTDERLHHDIHQSSNWKDL